jgi:hypothetical protein
VTGQLAPIHRRYPFARLAGVMGLTEPEACRALGISGTTEQQYRRDGLSEKVADRMAAKAGHVVWTIWPEWLDDSIEALTVKCAAPDCPVTFVAPVPGHQQKPRKFCCRTCQQRTNARDAYRNNPADRERRKSDARRYKAETRAARERREQRREEAA